MPSRSRRQAGPISVEALTHDDKRVNLPTADAAEAYDYEPEIPTVRYSRDPTLDPQLVWRGKDEQDSGDLVADAPPIYIQEKIAPKVLIENLRRISRNTDLQTEPTLFDDGYGTFDGLDPLATVEFYQHEADWSNRMILGDSLQVMASLAEQEGLRSKVQMIYIDPPYGIKFGSNWQASARKRDVKDGKLADAAREAEQIKAFRDSWELGIHSYLSYLRDRLTVARDLLTESGSCFVQIGDENVHLVRSLMDEVFGSDNFVAQIALTKSGGGLDSVRRIPTRLDYIVWFGKAFKTTKYRSLFEERIDAEAGGFINLMLADGVLRSMTREERNGEVSLPVGSRVFRTESLTKPGPGSRYVIEWNGDLYTAGNRWWGNPKETLEKLLILGRVRRFGNTLRYIRFIDDFGANRLSNLWDGIGGASDPIYVVQTATKVIERCMLMCTDPGDLVLDPTCGSGTTVCVAEQWGRRWITIDTSRVALALARQRVMGARFPHYLKADSPEGRAKEQEIIGKPLPPSETHGDIKQGFVYERVQHVTLKSIANNPDIREGMSRAEIDAAIKRHADYEVLYDRPYEDRGKVRVAGRFTVESLSPHRSVAFAGAQDESGSEQAAATDATAPTFEQTILDNLAKAGIQNGRRDERIRFAVLDPYPGQYLQAIGERDLGDDSVASTRVGIAIGPQYGTVSPGFIKAAAREAIRAEVDLVTVLGFAFDAQATEVTETDGVTVTPSDNGFATVAGERRLGRIPVLLVRMNVDLLMGEELKKSGAGNLFTVFGEPDIEIRDTDDAKIVVEIKGVDVFDPTTGEVRSNDTGQIALWMIDTDYDEESFFVRHCYFTGGNDPFKRLKAALRADVDSEAWESLYRTTSRPFDRPESGKIAVKVINDYGDEVMKVFDL